MTDRGAPKFGIRGGGAFDTTTSFPIGFFSVAMFMWDGARWNVLSGQQDTGWVAPTLTNGWTNVGGALVPAGWRQTGNMVQPRGAVQGGTNGLAVFTLPAGARPPATHTYGVNGGTVQVTAAGAVTASGAGIVYLEGVAPFSTS